MLISNGLGEIIMTIDEQVYRRLQEHLDRLPIGFPATESGVEIELLKHFFTPVEAGIALCLGLTSASPKTIRRRLRRVCGIDLEPDELSSILDRLFMQGSIGRSVKRGSPAYHIEMLAIGMFEFHVDHLTGRLMELMHRYFDEAFGSEFFRSSLPQLRTSPHARALVPEYRIDTYDNMRACVQDTDQTIQVANCVCKQGEALLGRPCKQTDNIEICLLFGSESYLERNQSRIISKEECLSILDMAEERGLVLQPGNSREPFCICLCCGCCCGVLTTAKKFPKPAELLVSNYYAVIDPEKCTGCGLCLRRCQMEALDIVDGVAMVNLDRCIGCGLCVTRCPADAAKLIKKKKVTVPPRNAVTLYLSILYEKAGKKRMMMNMLKLLVGKPL